jgi:hypothetical protein
MSTIDVYVIDKRSDIVMAVDRALTVGELDIGSVRDLAAQVSKLCSGGDRVRELRIVGHGNETGQYVGGDWLCDLNVHAFAPHWALLKKCFDPTCGSVTFGGCKVGQAELLMVKLSHHLGVPVRGFRTFQNPIIPGDEGGETRCVYFGCTRTYKDATVYNEWQKSAFEW